MTGDTCPTGCGRSVEFGKLMCPPCWSKVPRDLQRKVYLTWSDHRKLMSGERTPDRVRQSRERYEQAKEAALAAIA